MPTTRKTKHPRYSQKLPVSIAQEPKPYEITMLTAPYRMSDSRSPNHLDFVTLLVFAIFFLPGSSLHTEV